MSIFVVVKCPWNAKRSRLPKCTCKVKRKCKYRLYATRLDDGLTFQIRSLNLEHVCAFTTKNRMVTSEYIAEKYLETWRNDPNWSLIGVQSRVKFDLGVDVGYHKCWVARARAKMMIHGNLDGQYSRVWDYVFQIRKFNPGSPTCVKVDRIDRPPPIFQIMYICLAACKEGFVKRCRPLLGVDGCHLKGQYPGMCLVVVSMDVNNNIFSVAWAVVEVENAETWQWFLDLLVRDIGSDEGDGLTFMSDRQKGLLEAMNVVVPSAETRFCVRHIWANFKLQFAGIGFKENFWKAAWATTEAEFNFEMAGIKYLSEGAYNYLNRIPPRHWSRHAFSTNYKSSMITNNLCESFNAVLKDAKDKAILTHMEWMRRYVMKRNYEKREGVDKYDDDFMPYIDKCFKKMYTEVRYAKVHPSKSTNFEVDYKGGNFTVNLVEQKFNCKHWELSGIPCIHAMACIVNQRLIPKDYVNDAYSKEKYLLAYSPAFSQMPGVDQWEKTGLDEPLPPPPPPYQEGCLEGLPIRKEKRSRVKGVK
ncbi:uncharacterized protein LOC141641060 [Silene latifolia]|uniref:uncharacterized protein LOC141641060 n=1 Tax=Silene latifolia TaxID=37657 RepID=UPI003D77D1D8